MKTKFIVQIQRSNMNWNGNLDSSIGKSVRLVILEIRGSNPDSGSNFSLEIQIVKNYRLQVCLHLIIDLNFIFI